MQECDEFKGIITKRDSRILYGLAAIMMVYHHLFLTKGVLDFPVTYSLFNFIHIGNREGYITVAYFCKICVGIYAFISGYAAYKNIGFVLKEDRGMKGFFEAYKKVVKQLLKFIIIYWIICIVFVSVGYIVGAKEEQNVSGLDILWNIIGIKSDWNGGWWYIQQYYIMMLLFPVIEYFIVSIIKNIKVVTFGYIVISIIVIVSYHIETNNAILNKLNYSTKFIYLMIFVSGIICSNIKFPQFNKVVYLFLLISVVGLRIILADNPDYKVTDMIIVPVFILSLINILGVNIVVCRLLRRFLFFVGKYSVFIWLIHGFIFAYYLKCILLPTKYTIIAFLEVFIYSLMFSLLIERVYKFIGSKFMNYIKK